MNASEIKQKVMDQVGISEFDYDHEVFEAGVAFIHTICGEMKDIVRIISYNKKYWAWWNNQFQIADLRMLEHPITKTDWLNMHSPSECMVYPPSAMFEETYEQLISEINKEAELC